MKQKKTPDVNLLLGLPEMRTLANRRSEGGLHIWFMVLFAVLQERTVIV